MKYIRTKDGKIIDFTPKPKYQNDKETFNWFVNNYCGGFHNIIAQADTIEELCDMFVYNQIPIKKTDSMFEEIRRYYKTRYEKDLFGAIWTDKGLIYVAKMNEKGELELL